MACFSNSMSIATRLRLIAPGLHERENEAIVLGFVAKV